jgi:hypothetical protein
VAESKPDTAVTEALDAVPADEGPGELHTVSEILADRAAAPSPFGDDQTFPLPLDQLTYTPTTTP